MTWSGNKLFDSKYCHSPQNTFCIKSADDKKSQHTRGDQKVRGKVLLNRIAFIDCNENSYI